MDAAQKTRFITFETEFDVKLLAKYMEEEGVRSEFINFALIYPEIFEDNQNNTQATGRTFMAFARTLESVKDLGSSDGLERSLDIAAGIFDSKENLIGAKFTLFINNKLDKLITPEDLVFKPWKDVAAILDKSVGDVDSDKYRTDIAATLTFRLVNYTLMNFAKQGVPSAPFVDRILEIVNHKKQYLAVDLLFAMASKLAEGNITKISKLFVDPKFKNLLLS